MTSPNINESPFLDVATLTTTRLRLVPLGTEHLDEVLAGLADPETVRLTGTRQEFTRADVAQHLTSLPTRDDRLDWAIIDLETESYIGEIVLNELDEENASMNFRIALMPRWTGQGYGTEATGAVLDHAFDEIDLHRVALDVYSFNPRAARSYEKAGFRYEGRQRHTLFWEGDWVDSILMSILRTDDRPGH